MNDLVVKRSRHLQQHQLIPVPDEVAGFLEQDRLRENAQRKSDQWYLNIAGNDICSTPGLLSDNATDPTPQRAFLLLQKHKLREIFPGW